MSNTYSYDEDDNEEVDKNVEQGEGDLSVAVLFDKIADHTGKEANADKATPAMVQIRSEIYALNDSYQRYAGPLHESHQSQIDALNDSYQRNAGPLYESYRVEMEPLVQKYDELFEKDKKDYSERVNATRKKTKVFHRNHARIEICFLLTLTLTTFYFLTICMLGLKGLRCWSNHYWNVTVPVCQQALAAAAPMPPQCLLRYHTQSLCSSVKMASFRGSWSEFFDMLRRVTMPPLLLSQLIFITLMESGVYLYYDRRYRAAWLSEFSDLRVSERRDARLSTRCLAFTYVALFSLGVLFWQLNILDSITIQWYRMACLSYATVAAYFLFTLVIQHTFTTQIPRTFMVWQDGHWQKRQYESDEVLPGCRSGNPNPFDQNTVVIYWT
jgi:hypothetical protein